jgi:hypothetical protein
MPSRIDKKKSTSGYCGTGKTNRRFQKYQKAKTNYL